MPQKSAFINNVSIMFLGVRVNSSSTYYYTKNREHCRFPWRDRNFMGDVEIMENIENEDRVSVKAKLAKESGYTGKSILIRLHALYGFDVSKDMVYDTMHNIPMNIVKKYLDYLVDSGKVNGEEVDIRMENMMWSKGIQ